jgi:arsenate reductase
LKNTDIVRLTAAYMRIYTLKTCDTCRKASKWLKEQQIPFQEQAIREQPPTPHELRLAITFHGDIRKLFNVSGQDYRKLHLKDTLPSMSEESAIELLASNGNLIKRPFLVYKDSAIAGFDAEKWIAISKDIPVNE